MLTVRKNGRDWIKVRSLLRNYSERLRFVRDRTARLAAQAFLDEIKKRAPRQSEFRSYIDALHIVRLVSKGTGTAYAVISGEMQEPLRDIVEDDSRSKNTVIYVTIRNDTVIPDGADILAGHNPWPARLLPKSLPMGLALTSRVVTNDEMEWAINQTRAFLKEHKIEISQLNMTFDDTWDDAALDTETSPDVLTLALRAEFATNTGGNPHWMPTLRWLRTNFARVIEGDNDLHRAICDWLFRGHTVAEFDDTESSIDFNKIYGSFQETVVTHA